MYRAEAPRVGTHAPDMGTADPYLADEDAILVHLGRIARRLADGHVVSRADEVFAQAAVVVFQGLASHCEEALAQSPPSNLSEIVEEDSSEDEELTSVGKSAKRTPKKSRRSRKA